MKEANEALVSVIVAIYKVGDYLEQCLQSIINQTYRNIEIILVDDGSPDSCPTICDEFSKVDSRVQVVHKKNEGSVYARKTGLMNATGKYVLMVDGDDYMDPCYITNLVSKAEEDEADVVVDSFLTSYPNKEFVEKMHHKVGTYRDNKLEELKQKLIYSGTYFEFGINPALWNKLFRKDKLMEYYQNVPRQLTLGEDFAVSIPFMAGAECISVIDSDAYYHYRQRENSMVRAYDPKLNYKVECLILFLNQQERLKPYTEQLNYYYSWLYISCMKNDALQICKEAYLMASLKKTNSLFRKYLTVENITCSKRKYRMIFFLTENQNWRVLSLLIRLNNMVKRKKIA